MANNNLRKKIDETLFPFANFIQDGNYIVADSLLFQQHSNKKSIRDFLMHNFYKFHIFVVQSKCLEEEDAFVLYRLKQFLYNALSL